MKNNRFYKRYAVKCSGYIIDNQYQKTRFQVNDISACGMNINAEKRIEDSHLVTIFFDLTACRLPHAKQLKGFVTRKKLSNTVFNYSIRFLELTHTEIIEIDEYLQYISNRYNIPAEESDAMYL